MEAVGNAELNQFIDQGRDVFSLLRDLFLDGRNGVSADDDAVSAGADAVFSAIYLFSTRHAVPLVTTSNIDLPSPEISL